MIALAMFDPGDPGSGDFPPHWFIALFAVMFGLVLVLGIGSMLWRASAARRMAAAAGLDPKDATALSVLSEDGLAATYLASNLQGKVGAGTPAQRSAEERLAELGHLRDSGTITEAEYATRRQAIIDSV